MLRILAVPITLRSTVIEYQIRRIGERTGCAAAIALDAPLMFNGEDFTHKAAKRCAA